MAASKFLVLFALVACTTATNFFTDNRIIGGDVAPQGLAPFAVSLRTGALVKSHFCGGSLISMNFVITAAHCVDAVYSSSIIGGGLSSNLQVLSGTQNLNSGGVKSSVKANYTYGMWDAHNLRYDVGLFELKTALTEGPGQMAIPLNPKVIAADEELTAVGWGLTKYPNGNAATELKYLKTTTLDFKTCKEMRDVASTQFPGYFPDVYDEQEICTFKVVGEGMCKGDSGSALFNDDGLVGIVSWGLPCAKLAPDIFTRVSTFVSWIEDIAK